MAGVQPPTLLQVWYNKQISTFEEVKKHKLRKKHGLPSSLSAES